MHCFYTAKNMRPYKSGADVFRAKLPFIKYIMVIFQKMRNAKFDTGRLMDAPVDLHLVNYPVHLDK